MKKKEKEKEALTFGPGCPAKERKIEKVRYVRWIKNTTKEEGSFLLLH